VCSSDLWELLSDHGLGCFAISTHLVGQAVCDPIDVRHRAILPEHVWGDGDPEGVRRRAAQEMVATAAAARQFFDAAPTAVKARLELSGRSVCFALEVHPTEIAFDIATARRALQAVGGHRRFGFNFDPSHFGYQGVDYLAFLAEFGARVFNVHVKDVWWSDRPTPIGTFGGHSDFGAPGRAWDFRSPGRGRIDFEGIVRALNRAGYEGPLTVEWEDPEMDREAGAAEAA